MGNDIVNKLTKSYEEEAFKDPGFWFDRDEDPLVDYLMTDTKIHSIVFLSFMIHAALFGVDLLLHLLPTGKVGWWVRHLFFGGALLGDFAINLIAIWATYSVQLTEKANGKVWSKKYYVIGAVFAMVQAFHLLISVVTFGPLRLIKKYVLDYLFEFIRVVYWAAVPLYVTIHVLWLDSNVFTYIGKAFQNPGEIKPANLQFNQASLLKRRG